MAEIGRILTAMVTPFYPGRGVNYQEASRLANALLDSGSDGVVIAGTTGESPTLTREEKIRLFFTVKKAVGDRGVVIAGTSNYNTAESVGFTKKAESTGVDGALLVVPPYNKPPQEGLYQHFEAIADATKLPCILYNVPGRTSLNMTAATTLRLAQTPNIIGIKEASGDMKQVVEIIRSAPEGFLVWSGNDQDTLPIIQLGGFGVVSVIGHLVSGQIKQMIEAQLQGHDKVAHEIHERLLPLVEACFKVSNPIPVKYALRKLGVKVGEPRLPLVEPDEETGEEIMAQVRKHQIDLTLAA